VSHDVEDWDHPQPFTLKHRITDADIDGLNHTNNTVYVKWCEKVAWAHSVALGLDLEAYRSLNRAMVITHANYHYLKASVEGQDIVAATWITDWDKKVTMKREFQIIRVEDGATLLRGKMQFACIDITSGRPKRMPKEFLDGYRGAVLSEQC
jgi:acyl-CoA thioester hydrolase